MLRRRNKGEADTTMRQRRTTSIKHNKTKKDEQVVEPLDEDSLTGAADVAMDSVQKLEVMLRLSIFLHDQT